MGELVDVFAVPTRHALGEQNLLFDTGPRVAVGPGGIDGFWERLDTFLGEGLLMSLASLPHVVVAGGCVVGALTSTSASDVDLFILGDPASGATTLRRLLALVQQAHASSDLHQVVVTRSAHAVTLYRTCGTEVVGPPIQLVLRVTQTVEELLAGFDIDCCCAAFVLNEKRVLCSERGLRALCSGVNHLDDFFDSPSYWRRLEKYGLRGWRVAGMRASGQDTSCVAHCASADLVLRLHSAVQCCDEPLCFVQAAHPLNGPERLLLRGSHMLSSPKAPSAGLSARLARVGADLSLLVWAPSDSEENEDNGPSDAPREPISALLRQSLLRGLSRSGSRFLFDVLSTSAGLEEAKCILDASVLHELPACDLQALGLPIRLTFCCA
jgi:hypothetical protein